MEEGGVFLAAIDSAYHYYLSTYGTSKVSRYDTHKKSQLRAVYNQIVKTNKDTPLYKIPDSTDVKKFAIDLKEHTRSIQNVIAALSDNDEGIENVFNKKVANLPTNLLSMLPTLVRIRVSIILCILMWR